MSVDADSWAMPRPWFQPGESDAGFVYGIAFWLALIQVSIAASQIVLAVLVCVWIYRAARGTVAVRSLPIDRPIAAYAALSLLAAFFSFDPVVSVQASKKLLLLLVPYLLVSTVRRKSSVESLVLVLIVMADIGALVGLWQYGFGDLGDLNHRIRGFMSHYMTYSGLLMSVGVLALAQALFHKRNRGFAVASLAIIGLALVLTLTRSAWLGMLLAGIVLVFLKNKKLLVFAPVVAVAAALVLPRDVERRLESFLRPDTSGLDRMYMLQAGGRIVANHPWLGVGPNMVAEVYPVYMVPGAPHRDNAHLHNNLVQIAAERGILCLAAWLWLVGVAFVASARAFRRSGDEPLARSLAAGAIGVLLAAFFAGLFEYNFGDSEFQMLFLFAVTIPWILERDGEESAETSK